MRSKVYQNAGEALGDLVADGMTLMCGGFGLCGMPESLIDALGASGVRNLTVVSNNAGIDGVGLARLIDAGQVRKMIASYVGTNKTFEQAYLNGRLELELSPQGTMSERIRAGGAGIAAFYTRTGVGTLVAEGKEHKQFGGRVYILEEALVADVALIRAETADTEGNLVFRKTARNFNPIMATAGRVTVAEVNRIVEAGQIEPDHVHTPGIFVQRIVLSAVPKRIEFVTNRQREA